MATCKKIMLHRERLERLKERYFFDEEEADRSVRFFEKNLLHWKDPFAGEPFILTEWQREDIVRPLFGLKQEEGGRRLFREAYIQIPRKNGKTALVSGCLLLILYTSQGGECYCAATKRDQAMIAFKDCKAFVERARPLKRRATVYQNHIEIPKAKSVLLPLSADYSSMDGLNVSGAIIDELHAHPNAKVHDVIMTATGSRSEPMVLKITTAGEESLGICHDQYEYSEKVLSGVIEDDSFFCYIAEADKELKFDDPAAYEMANPNIDVSISREYLERERQKAVSLPSYRKTYERYHLNRWIQAGTDKWIPLERWKQNLGDFTRDSVEGELCYGAFDLASVHDLTSFALVFPSEDGVRLLNWYWIPSGVVEEKVRIDRVPYDVWIDQGWVETTPGDSIDHEFLVERFLEIVARYRPKLLAYDDWNALTINQSLEKEGSVEMVKFVQGLRGFHPPSQEFERLVLDGELLHDGNPVTQWCASNAKVYRDPSGKMRPVKDYKSSRERIDGIIAAIMALDCHLRLRDSGKKGLATELMQRGIRSMIGL